MSILIIREENVKALQYQAMQRWKRQKQHVLIIPNVAALMTIVLVILVIGIHIKALIFILLLLIHIPHGQKVS